MNRLVCENCGTVYYSAAAKTLAEQGELCAKCGGRLMYGDGADEPQETPEATTGNSAD